MGSPFARIPKLNVAGYRSWTAWAFWAGVGSGSHRLPLPRRKVIPGDRTKSACKTAGPRDALVPAQKVQPHRRRWATEASTRQRCVEATDSMPADICNAVVNKPFPIARGGERGSTMPLKPLIWSEDVWPVPEESSC